jgi:hypothetical protein
MTPTQLAAATLIVIAGIGLAGAVLAGPFLDRRPGATGADVVRARAMSYAVLAGILAAAVLGGLPTLTILLAAIAAIALLEWSRLADLPSHHVVALEIASLAIMIAVAARGRGRRCAGRWARAGRRPLPVVRPDTTRAIRDFGVATIVTALSRATESARVESRRETRLVS